MKIIDTNGVYDFLPETKQEKEEFEELSEICVSEHVSELANILMKSDSLWKSIMITQQIFDDLSDVLFEFDHESLSVLYEDEYGYFASRIMEVELSELKKMLESEIAEWKLDLIREQIQTLS